MAGHRASYLRGGSQRILLAGDVGSVFLNAGSAVSNYDFCRDIPDAIDAASRNSFDVVGVVMYGTPKLESALKDLRKRCGAKIILLAQMYEEPIAIRLVGSSFNGSSLADDYLICPLEADRLYESILSHQEGAGGGNVSSVGVNATVENRIRLLEKLATEDDLTTLKNRRYIWEFSRQIIERAKQINGRVTLLVFDIDNFKHYNDVYGHFAGDEILKQAAVLMLRCCRSHDVVGRIGGDEFAVVFWDGGQAKSSGKETERRSALADHPREAIFIAKRFRGEFKRAELHLLGPEGRGVLTISGGLASYPYDGSTIEELFQQADNALLEAKRSGKNRIYLVGKPSSDIADIE